MSSLFRFVSSFKKGSLYAAEEVECEACGEELSFSNMHVFTSVRIIRQPPGRNRTIIATIRAIGPGIAQTCPAAATGIPVRPYIITTLNKKQDNTGDQVGNDKRPADRRDMQVISDDTMTTAEQPDVAHNYRQDSHRAKNHKPGVFVFSKFYLHMLATSLECLHQGQYFTQRSCTLPQPRQVSRKTIRHCGHTSQPDTTCAEQPGHSPVKGFSAGAGLSTSIQIK